MTPIPITAKNGKARPKNPFDEYQTNAVGDSTWKRTQEWKDFESTVQWHDCPEATEDGEFKAELVWQAKKPDFKEHIRVWFDIEENDRDFYSEYGCSFRQVWRIVPQPQEKQTMEKMMPVLNWKEYKDFECPEKVPFSLLNEVQAGKNHMQTLSRLSERGGLVPSEMIAIIENRNWRSMDKKNSVDLLKHYLTKHATPVPQKEEAKTVEGKTPAIIYKANQFWPAVFFILMTQDVSLNLKILDINSKFPFC